MEKSHGHTDSLSNFSNILTIYSKMIYDFIMRVRESQKVGRMHGTPNSTLFFLILKKKSANLFEDYTPISYYNIVYKLSTKIIATILRHVISMVIEEEQFGFSHNKKIYDVVAKSQEVLH